MSDSLVTTYPSLELAYKVAISSYDVMQKRVESVETGIQTLLTYAITVSLAVPAVSAAKGLSFRSIWFALAVGAFILAIGTGVRARQMRGLVHLDPKVIYEKFLHYSESEFRVKLIVSAATDFEVNRNLVNSKLRWADIASLLFTLELILLVIWMSAAAKG